MALFPHSRGYLVDQRSLRFECYFLDSPPETGSASRRRRRRRSSNSDVVDRRRSPQRILSTSTCPLTMTPRIPCAGASRSRHHREIAAASRHPRGARHLTISSMSGGRPSSLAARSTSPARSRSRIAPRGYALDEWHHTGLEAELGEQGDVAATAPAEADGARDHHARPERSQHRVGLQPAGPSPAEPRCSRRRRAPPHPGLAQQLETGVPASSGARRLSPQLSADAGPTGHMPIGVGLRCRSLGQDPNNRPSMSRCNAV